MLAVMVMMVLETGGTWMSKARNICPRQRKGQAVRGKLETLLVEESALRIAGRPVPKKLKDELRRLEARMAEIQSMPSTAPCLFCSAEVDLTSTSGYTMSIRQTVSLSTGVLKYWGRGTADGLDVAICENCIYKINDYDDLITEELED